MNKKKLTIVAGLLLVVGLLSSIPYILLKTKAPKATQQLQSTAPAGGHRHGAPIAPAPAQVKEQSVEEEAPTVEIAAEKQQMIGVKTASVSVKPFMKTIRTVGRIEYDERRVSMVNTKIDGWIERLYVDYVGRYVTKGEPLAEIYSPELVATQQEFINLMKWRNAKSQDNIGSMLSRDAETIIEAAKRRFRLWDITDEQIKKIEETEKPIRTLTIYSPVSGYVADKKVHQGMKIVSGEIIVTVADLSSLWILADIYEYEMPLIKAGQAAKISLSYFPGKEFISKIDYIYPSLAGETRTTKVRFTIPNPGMQLKPQMFTNVEIKVDLGKRLVVPDDAVIDTGARQIVYVDKGEGNFEPREVKVGLKADGLAEILQGLKAGEKIASSANFLIDSEAQLKGVTPLHKH